MPRILIVDDSRVDRRLAGELLAMGGGWTTACAADGNEALEQLQKGPFDLVLTDLIMPGMNGLEFLAAVRARYPHVPVILMTSHGSAEIAARALDEGAASYVPKPLLARRLVETVDRLFPDSQARRQRSPLLDRMTEACCSFALTNDQRLAENLVSHLQEQVVQMGLCDEMESLRMGVALQEALANAILHGNLQVGSEFRDGCHAEYHSLIARRRVEPPYRDRRVHVTARMTREEAAFVIRDEGDGFDPSTLPDPRNPADLEKASGRGVLLMRSFMDEVRFEEGGRSVTLIKRRRAAAEERRRGG